MRRLLASTLLYLLPFMAAAQVWAPSVTVSPPRLPVTTSLDSSQSEWVLPVWRSADGRWMALAVTGTSRGSATFDGGLDSSVTAVPLTATGLELVDASSVLSTGVRWSIAPNVFARAGVNQRIDAMGGDCQASMFGFEADCTRTPLWLGGELGGGIEVNRFSIDLGVSWLDHTNESAPTLLPMDSFMGPGLLGVPPEFVDSLGGVNARGSMRLGDSDTSVSLGASMGRLSLLPGTGLGLQSIDQKALSLGIGTGPINGLIVGRVMQPMQELDNPLSQSGRSWSAVDLGITLRLPWEGEISVGAQNVWSSGAAPIPSAATDPAQRRVPYIQYHQEL